MTHRTAATALLLASLPYGLALPQVIPLVSELVPAVTPRPLVLPFAPEYLSTASKVTVVGTIVETSVASEIEDSTDVFDDATETASSALESATDVIFDPLSTDAGSILDPDANILPLILPGILPVETDLPPLETPDVLPSDLPALDDGNLDGNDLTDFTDFPDEQTIPISTFNAVIQPLISVIQVLLNSLPGNFAPPLPGIFTHPLLPTATPDIFIDPILPTETPDIFVDPLLPTETLDDADVPTATDAVDPLLDAFLADSVATDLPFVKRQDASDFETSSYYALIAPIIDAINSLIAQISPADTDAGPAVEAAAPTLAALPVEVPSVPLDAPAFPLPNITLPNLPALNLSSSIAFNLPTDIPIVSEVSLPGFTFSGVPTDVLALPTDVPAVSELPLSILPTDVLDLPFSILPTDIPLLPTDLPALPTEISPLVPDTPDPLYDPLPAMDAINWAEWESPPFADLPTSGSVNVPISTDVSNVPVPDVDEFGVPIDSPLDTPDLPAAIPSLPLPSLVKPSFEVPSLALPTSLDDFPIPDNVLNVPVPDVDEFGVPIDSPLDAVSALPSEPSTLPTLLDWPFDDFEIPDTLTPEADGILPDLSDLPTPIALPTDLATPALPTVVVSSIPTELPTLLVPEISTDVATDVSSLALPTEFSVPALPTAVSGLLLPDPANLPLPTDVFDIPVPEGFEDLGDLPDSTDVAATLPTDLEDFPIPTDVMNIPVPDLDDNGVPIDLPSVLESGVADLPTLPTDLADLPTLPTDFADLPTLPTDFADLPLPTDLFDVPVPEGFEDLGDAPDTLPSALPTVDSTEPSIPTDVLNVPVPDLNDLGVPLDLPTDLGTDLPAFPTDFGDQPLPTNLFDVPVPEGFEDIGEDPDLPALPLSAFGAGFPVEIASDLPIVFPSVATDALPVLSGVAVSSPPTESLLPAEGLPTLPTEILTAVSTEALSVPAFSVPTVPVSEVSVPALSISAASLPAFSVPAVSVPAVSVPTPSVPALSVPAVSTPVVAVPVVSVPAIIVSPVPVIAAQPVVPIVPTLQGVVPASVIAPATVPAIAVVPAVPTLQSIAPRPVTIPKLPLQVPAPFAKRVMTADQAASVNNLPPGSAIALGLLKPLFNLLSTLLAKLPGLKAVPHLGAGLPVPSIASIHPAPVVSILPAPVVSILPAPVVSILPALPATSNATSIVPRVTAVAETASILPAFDFGSYTPPAASTTEVPDVVASILPAFDFGSYTPPGPSAVSAVPGISEVDSTTSDALPKIPLAFDSGIMKRRIQTADTLDTIEVLNLVKTISDLITGLLKTIAPALPNVGHVKRQLLGVSPGAISAVTAPAPDAVSSAAVMQVVQSLLRVIGQLLGNLPAPELYQVDLLNKLGNLGKREMESVTGTATDASTNTLALTLLPSLIELRNSLIAAIPAPAADTASINLPHVRRALEAFQQGPASNWESLVGELDESKQGELNRMVYDTAKAVNTGKLDSLASTLKEDLAHLSEATKAKLLTSAPVLANMEKRTMRHGKRQSVPGAQSIGPNLDDAQKVDLSAILGPNGTLDPLGQLSQAGAAGSPVDDLPDDYLDSSQAAPTNLQLEESSEATGLNPDLSTILGAAGTLDPNGMLGASQYTKPGSLVDDDNAGQDPYADLRDGTWDSALNGPPAQELDGLTATLQASKDNHIGGSTPDLPFVASAPAGGSAAAAQEQAASVLKWFQRYIKPSMRSDVDAMIMQ